jgi:FAD/FMN-containing dehydrogenase/NAD-dependent dihydropyrimidine dehydrogenase PreA subunit
MFCTVGGMASMNASGENSIKYGDTLNNISKISFMMSNGKIVEIENKYYSEDEIENHLLKEIFRKLKTVFSESIGQINEQKSDAIRNCDGYNIWNAYSEGRINLLNIIVGSEGTLGIITDLTLKIFDRHTSVGIISVGFTESNRHLIRGIIDESKGYGPSAIEYVDKTTILLRRKYTPKIVEWIDNSIEEMIFIEFEEYSDEETERKINGITRYLNGLNPGLLVKVSYGREAFEKVIAIRRGTQTLKNREENGKLAVAIIEDASVEPGKIFAFKERMKALLEKYNLTPFIAGHIGIGNLHMYPCFNLGDENDMKTMEKLSHEFTEIVREYNGCITAEHGIGITRTGMLSLRYDEKIIEVMKRIKTIFDSDGIFNPGKITGLDPSRLKYENSVFDSDIVRKYNISPMLTDILNKCHGCGKCFSFCPSYLLYNDEKCSPRGRIVFLTEILKGRINIEHVDPETINKISKTCFNC